MIFFFSPFFKFYPRCIYFQLENYNPLPLPSPSLLPPFSSPPLCKECTNLFLHKSLLYHLHLNNLMHSQCSIIPTYPSFLDPPHSLSLPSLVHPTLRLFHPLTYPKAHPTSSSFLDLPHLTSPSFLDLPHLTSLSFLDLPHPTSPSFLDLPHLTSPSFLDLHHLTSPSFLDPLNYAYSPFN